MGDTVMAQPVRGSPRDTRAYIAIAGPWVRFSSVKKVSRDGLVYCQSQMCYRTGKKLNIDRGVLSSANVLKLW